MVNLIQTSRCRLRLALNQMHQRKKDVLNEQHTLQRNMIRVEIRVSELEELKPRPVQLLRHFQHLHERELPPRRRYSEPS